MLFCYADPPYPRQAKRYKKADVRAAEVDHEKLIDHLEECFPDGWALSTHEPGLDIVLPLCAARGWTLTNRGIRMGVWVKPFHIYKPGVNPSYGYEPVIFRGGRKRTREQPTLRNFVSCNITLRKGLAGVKPEVVNEWILDFLNVQEGDMLMDLYPGSGGMGVVAQRRGVCVFEGIDDYEGLNAA